MNPMRNTGNPIAALGRRGIGAINTIGRTGLFFYCGVVHLFSRPLQVRRIIHQLYAIGFKSLLVIALTSVFTGMVLGLQGYYTLVKFGSEGMLGAAVGLSLIREMGPVLTAIMVTARVGSAMAAEIGVMRISEQIDALETMDINPIRFLFSPRIGAALISLPLLTAFFDVVGILGGYFAGSVVLGINAGIYFSSVASSVDIQDISGGMLKAVCFAALVTTICCCQGFYAHLRKDVFGAKAVSVSTTSAVVTSCVAVLVVDYLITSFLV